MSRWELIDSAVVPGDGDELRLYRRGGEYSIRIPGHGELMNSRTHGSEDALGQIPCQKLAPRQAARVLIGGLGMGFTLSATLGQLTQDASVLVAELVPDVVRWNEGPLGACAGYPVRDHRVRVHIGDVGKAIRNARDEFDAILLDVDNGPEGLTRPGNNRLYSPSGLADAYDALTPGGILAVWSAGPERRFTAELAKSGFQVDERRVRAHGGKGARHHIWLAERPA